MAGDFKEPATTVLSAILEPRYVSRGVHCWQPQHIYIYIYIYTYSHQTTVKTVAHVQVLADPSVMAPFALELLQT